MDRFEKFKRIRNQNSKDYRLVTFILQPLVGHFISRGRYYKLETKAKPTILWCESSWQVWYFQPFELLQNVFFSTNDSRDEAQSLVHVLEFSRKNNQATKVSGQKWDASYQTFRVFLLNNILPHNSGVFSLFSRSIGRAVSYNYEVRLHFELISMQLSSKEIVQR